MHVDHSSQLRELDETVLLARQALKLQAPPHPLHSESLDNLADALCTRFQEGGQANDLAETISLYRQALELRPSPDPLRPASLNNLSKVLLIHFLQGGQPSDLEEAILLPKQALELQPLTHPLRSSSLHNIALALFRQFEVAGQQSDLDDSISLHRQALELRAPPHPLRSASLSDLAAALRVQFEQAGHQNDLDEAVSLHRQALELRLSPHPLRSTSLNNLAIALSTRFEHEGHRSDLDEAVLLHRQALKLRPSPHPLRPFSLNNLAGTLWQTFKQYGHLSNLDEAILLHRQAFELYPPHVRSMSLGNLASALNTRFEHGGNRSDLDEAILFQRQALELRPEPHPLRTFSLGSLANVLQTRFEQEGQRSDLDEAVLLHRQVLELRPPPHPFRSLSFNNLANVLQTRFEQEGRRSDLDEAVLLNKQALELQPSPHPLRSFSSNNLAILLRKRFEQEGHKQYLDESISLHRQALQLRALPHPLRSVSLSDLAVALQMRFMQEGHQIDLDEAILLHRQALDLRPSPHPHQSQSFYDLAIVLIHAHSLAGTNIDYLEEAMLSFFSATKCLNQPASLRLRIANTWIQKATLHQHVSAIEAYDAALQALPKLAALSFDVKSRQEALLTNCDGLARDAARFAIQAGNIDKAIEFLEAGRAIFWSQFLSLRSSLERLNDIAPELAVKLRDAATGLELGSHRNTLVDSSENRQKLVIDQETARLNRLNEEWSQALDNVRHLNGFENFLRPHSLSALQVAASQGPVVMLVGNDGGSDIMILTSANLRTIHLSGLPNHKLQTLVHLIRLASSHSLHPHIENYSGNITEFPPATMDSLRNWMELDEERAMTRMRYKDKKDSDLVFKLALETLWKEVVKPVIEILDLKKSEEPPVIHWCPTGLFSFLPIHAAGCYDDNLAAECASDYFISSYTPTIGALLTEDRTPPTESLKMMVVIQSRDLPSTRKELEKIEQYVSNDFLIRLGVQGTNASVEAVASRLSDVAIVHFSCHGKQDRANPLDSGLKLDDGFLSVSRIMREKIPNGALAFLCACETAMGDDKLPDEAMSLGASLLFCGFRRVIATMWGVRDEDGPIITDSFYRELFRGPDGKPTQELDARKSARALHLAVKELRAKSVSFRRWVPFIHMGK